MCAYTKLLQSCLTLCNTVDCSPPGSSVHGILQARILEWVAMPFSRGSSRPRDQIQVSWIVRQILSHLRNPICCSSNRKKHGSGQDWARRTGTGYSPSPFRGCRLELDARREPDKYRDAVWHVCDARTWEDSRWRGKASSPEHAVQPLQSHWPTQFAKLYFTV